MHDLRLIHTDLKPENILLVSPEYVKVPDYKVYATSSSSSSPSSRCVWGIKSQTQPFFYERN